MLENEPEVIEIFFVFFTIFNLILKKVELFTETSLKKLMTQFDKKFAKNQEMRIKYPENPEK